MQISDIHKLTDLRHLNLFSVHYRDKKGKDKIWTYASRSRLDNPRDKTDSLPDAVVVVPFHITEKKLVIIKEFKVVLGAYQYGFPAGLLDPGEDVQQAGKRELFEETGLNLIKVVDRSPAAYSSSGMTDESVSMLYARCDGSPTSAHTEDSEDIQVKMVTREEAGLLLSEPHALFDVKTWIVLHTFASHGVF
jgi:ADP-ribose pyrophosphatase